MPDCLKVLVAGIGEGASQIKKAETFCMAFAIDFLQQRGRSGNFEKVDSHYDADGLVTTYRCAIDGRIYTVKVTPSKP
ncbi:MAG: hypothetical protein IMZ61_10020 [Planctomycetes bacterium]|nr:hypothetical protein [Planctomycetota bacterium]